MRRKRKFLSESLEHRICLSGNYNVELYLDVDEGSDSSYPAEFVEFNGDLLFASNPPEATISPETVNPSFWRTDGNTAVELADLHMEEANGTFTTFSWVELDQSTDWPFDTILLGSQISRPLVIDEQIFFVHDYGYTWGGDYIEAADVWLSDGTAPGTRILHRYGKAQRGIGGAYEYPLASFQDELVYPLNGWDRLPPRGVIRFDGESKTRILPFPQRSPTTWLAELPNVGLLVPFNSSLFVLTATGEFNPVPIDVPDTRVFVVSHAAAGKKPAFAMSQTHAFFHTQWRVGMANPLDVIMKSDGTTEGTTPILGNYGYPLQLSPLGESLFIQTSHELWFAEDDLAVRMPIPDSKGMMTSIEPAVLDATLYFVIWDISATGRAELWKSDGTPEGTERVSVLGQLQEPQLTLFEVVTFAGQVFFTADDGQMGRELWKTDGITTGTELVMDIHPGPEGSNPMNLTVVGDVLYFSANDWVHGQEIWRVTTDEPRLAGDIDGDGQVAFSDFIILAHNFGRTDGATLAEGDLDEDGSVSLADFLILAENFGNRTN